MGLHRWVCPKLITVSTHDNRTLSATTQCFANKTDRCVINITILVKTRTGPSIKLQSSISTTIKDNSSIFLPPIHVLTSTLITKLRSVLQCKPQTNYYSLKPALPLFISGSGQCISVYTSGRQVIRPSDDKFTLNFSISNLTKYVVYVLLTQVTSNTTQTTHS
jgi:hypothetical protein